MNSIDSDLSRLDLTTKLDPTDVASKEQSKTKKKKKLVPKGTKKKNQELLQAQCAEHFELHLESTVKVGANSKIRFRKYSIQDFKIFCQIGQGGFGKVFMAKLIDSTSYFALKVMSKKKIEDYESLLVERKVMIYGNQNPFICRLFASFQTKESLCFAMEFCCGGDLKFHLLKEKRFDDYKLRFYSCEIICALIFLHRLGIIYRDLKLENIMIQFDGHLKLVDFGLCIGKVYRVEMRPSDFCGTPEYMAPEVIKSNKYNQSVDLWSLGIIIYEMFVGLPPFQGSDEDEICWNICNQNVPFPNLMPPQLKDLIRSLLVKNSEERIGMSTSPYGKLTEHTFFGSIDWKEVQTKKLVPPWKPLMSSPCDIPFFIRKTPKTIVSFQMESVDEQPDSLFADFDYTNAEMIS